MGDGNDLNPDSLRYVSDLVQDNSPAESVMGSERAQRGDVVSKKDLTLSQPPTSELAFFYPGAAKSSEESHDFDTLETEVATFEDGIELAFIQRGSDVDGLILRKNSSFSELLCNHVDKTLSMHCLSLGNSFTLGWSSEGFLDYLHVGPCGADGVGPAYGGMFRRRENGEWEVRSSELENGVVAKGEPVVFFRTGDEAFGMEVATHVEGDTQWLRCNGGDACLDVEIGKSEVVLHFFAKLGGTMRELMVAELPKDLPSSWGSLDNVVETMEDFAHSYDKAGVARELMDALEVRLSGSVAPPGGGRDYDSDSLPFV